MPIRYILDTKIYLEALVSGVKKKKNSILTDEVENTREVNYINYALSRGKTIEYMLQFPILSRPILLLEKDSLNLNTKKTKSELTKMLLGHLDKSTIITGSDIKCGLWCHHDRLYFCHKKAIVC